MNSFKNHKLDDDLLRKNPQVMEEEQPLQRCESEIFPTKGWSHNKDIKSNPDSQKVPGTRLHQGLREEVKTIIVCSLGLRKQPKMRKLCR